jgi:uncharacterized protein YkwD
MLTCFAFSICVGRLRRRETGSYRAAMTWASHPTTEMPPAAPAPVGRHRRRRPIIIAIIVAVVLIIAGTAVALNSPRLFSSPTPLPGEGLASPSTTTPVPSPTDGDLVSTTDTADPNGGTISTGPATESLEDQLVASTNTQRVPAKCQPLTVDDRLRTAAQVHAADMASYAYLSHTGHDGTDPAARIQAAGYKIDSTIGWAENVARGYPTVDAVMAAFLSSSDNRANILNCSLKVVGVGVARSVAGELYWTQDFGSAVAPPAA